MFEIIGFLFIQAFLFVLGAALGSACALFVFLMTPGAANRAKRVAIITAFLFPLISVFYLEAGFVIHDVVRFATGKDSVLDGLYHYPLGNGYVLKFFSETAPEGGWIDVPRGGSLAVDRIYSLQAADDFVFMNADPPPRQGNVPTVTIGNEPVHQSDAELLYSYVELNTKTHEWSGYTSLEELDEAAARRNIQLKLRSLDDLYGETVSAATPGWIFWGCMGAPLLIAGVWLLFRLRNLRSSRSSVGLNGFSSD